MDDLLIRFLSDEATHTEQVQVKHWISASKENQAHFDQLRLIWDTSLSLAPETPVDTNQAWQRFQQRVLPVQPVVRKVGFKGWKIAASASMLRAVAGALKTGRRKRLSLPGRSSAMDAAEVLGIAA